MLPSVIVWANSLRGGSSPKFVILGPKNFWGNKLTFVENSSFAFEKFYDNAKHICGFIAYWVVGYIFKKNAFPLVTVYVRYHMFDQNFLKLIGWKFASINYVISEYSAISHIYFYGFLSF